MKRNDYYTIIALQVLYFMNIGDSIKFNGSLSGL